MAYPSALDACKTDLYSDEASLFAKYPDDMARKILRVRAMHQWFLANPSAKDAQFIAEDISRHSISRPTAYSDLSVVKALLPLLSQCSQDFDRWRFREMTLRTFDVAEKRKDARSMAQAAANYAKFLNVDKERTEEFPIDRIIPQPFVATDDPSVLGIKPIPNLRERQRILYEKYAKETIDIEDITFEETDLRESELFEES